MTEIEERLDRMASMLRLRKMYADKCTELAAADTRIGNMVEHSKAQGDTYDAQTETLKGYKADYERLEKKHERFVNRVAESGLFKHAMKRAEKIARDHAGYAGWEKCSNAIADAIEKGKAE